MYTILRFFIEHRLEIQLFELMYLLVVDKTYTPTNFLLRPSDRISSVIMKPNATFVAMYLPT